MLPTILLNHSVWLQCGALVSFTLFWFLDCKGSAAKNWHLLQHHPGEIQVGVETKLPLPPLGLRLF